jgi:hypothetical protein
MTVPNAKASKMHSLLLVATAFPPMHVTFVSKVPSRSAPVTSGMARNQNVATSINVLPRGEKQMGKFVSTLRTVFKSLHRPMSDL